MAHAPAGRCTGDPSAILALIPALRSTSAGVPRTSSPVSTVHGRCRRWTSVRCARCRSSTACVLPSLMRCVTPWRRSRLFIPPAMGCAPGAGGRPCCAAIWRCCAMPAPLPATPGLLRPAGYTHWAGSEKGASPAALPRIPPAPGCAPSAVGVSPGRGPRFVDRRCAGHRLVGQRVLGKGAEPAGAGPAGCVNRRFPPGLFLSRTY